MFIMAAYAAGQINLLNAISVLAWITAFFLLKPIVTWTTRRMYRSRSLRDGRQLPPGSMGLVWLGETLQLISALHHGNPAKFYRERTARFRSLTFKTSLAQRATVVVQGVDANRFLAQGEARRVIKGSWPSHFKDLLGKHTPSALEGDEHHRQRQMLQRCLGPSAMQKVIGRVDSITRKHVQDVWRVGGRLSVVETLKKHTLSLAYYLFAGEDVEGKECDRLDELFKRWRGGLVCVPVNLPGTVFWKAKRARNLLRQHMEGLIRRRQQELRAAPAGSPGAEDILAFFLQARDRDGSVLSTEELRDLILFLIFGGYESISNTIAFLLKFIEENPDCRHRLLQEHEALAARKQAEPLSWRDVLEMKYTWAAVQETLRVRPPALASVKEALEDVYYDGYTIPKGWKIMYFVSATHESEAHFENPSKFDPDRFAREASEGKRPDPLAFLPFGLGHHMCKGVDFVRMTSSLYIHHLTLSEVFWKSLDSHEKYKCLPASTFPKGYPVHVCT